MQTLEPRILLSASPIAMISQAQSIDEGQTAELSAAGSYDPDAAPLTFSWDLNQDGIYTDAWGETVQFDSGMWSSGTPDGIPQAVSVEVSDGIDPPAYASSSVTVQNLPPDITSGSLTASANPGEPVDLSLSFFDPGTSDTHTVSVDWGDGFTEVLPPSPGTAGGTHTYTAPGTYAVAVTITDSDNATATWNGSVLINEPTFTASNPATVHEGEMFSLSVTASTHIDSWLIEWGDGTSETASPGSVLNASHTYVDDPAGAAPDIYSVSVTASLAGQTYQVAPIQITVNNIAPMWLSTPTLDTTPVFPRDTVHLSAMVTDPGLADTLTYTIDWGDGTAPVTGSPAGDQIQSSHMYSVDGSYTVSLTVSDDDGGQVTWQQAVTVNAIDPAVTAPAQVNEGEMFTLDLSSPASVDSWDIVWGDGTTETVASPGMTVSVTHTYADDDPTATPSDDYTIQVTANRAGQTYSADPRTITVNNIAPTWLSTPTLDTTPVFPGDTVHLSATVTDPGLADTLTYTINWGDGTAPVTGSPAGDQIQSSHMYSVDGSYTVSLAVSDDDGGQVTWQQAVTVNAIDPAVTAPAQVNEGEMFTLDLSSPASVDSWDIVWGDGTTENVSMPGTTVSVTHTYADDDPTATPSDDYTVQVTANRAGQTYSADPQTITVNNVAPTWITTPTLDTTPVYPGDTVNLSAAVTDPGLADTLTYTIDWGDGTTTTGSPAGDSLNASNIYATPGAHTVTVTVTDDDGGEAAWSGPIDIVNTAPLAMDDSYSLVHDTSLDVPASGILDNDSDAENQPLTAVLAAGPEHAESFTFNEDGSFTYEPESGWSGTDSFTYTVNDGFENSQTATVTLEVTNATPTFDMPSYDFLVEENAAIGTAVGTVTAADSDDALLTYEVLTNDVPFVVDPVTGEISVSNPLDYEAASTHTLAIIATDPGGQIGTAWVMVHVGGARLIESTAAGWEGGTVDFFFEATPNGGSITMIEIDVNADGVFDLSTMDYSPVSGRVLIMDAGVLHLLGAAVDEGNYSAVVRIATDDGLVSDFDFEISIGNTPPSADFTDSHQVAAGDVFTLAITASDPGPDTITAVDIDWGDGTTQTFSDLSGQFTHAYGSDGIYEVTFSLTDEDGTWTSSTWAVVGEVDLPPVPAAVPQVNLAIATLADPSTLAMQLELVEIAPYSGTITEISWDLDGDGLYGDAFGNSVVLAAGAGAYVADVQITDSGGFVGEAAFTFLGEGFVTAEPTKGTYGSLFRDATPAMPGGWQVHHWYEQKEGLTERLRLEKGINVHELSRLRGIRADIHAEITYLQNKWWKKIADAEFDGDIRRAYREVDLDRFITHADELNAEFGRYFMKSGQGSGRVAQIAKNITKDNGIPGIKKKRVSRLVKLGVVVGSIQFFDLIGKNVAVAGNIFRQPPEAAAAFDQFFSQYEQAIEQATGPAGRVKHNQALHLRDSAINYLTTLGYDRNDNCIQALEVITGAWVDANIAP